jgi:hypothetical protein
MHKDFAFCPAKNHRYTKEQLITPAKAVGNSLAGTALRSYTGVCASAGDILPGLKLGLIQLPQPVLLSHNNIYQSIGDPLPMQIIRSPESDEQDLWLLIFSDRTALLAIEDPDFGENLNTPLMRILPMVLRVSPTASTSPYPQYVSATYKLSIETRETRGHLMISRKSPAGEPVDLLMGPYGSDTVLEHASVIQTALAAEMAAWAKEIPKAPCVIEGDRDVLSGVFGEDRDAPDPSVEGLPFACPPALPQIHFTNDEYTDTARILHLAFVRLCETYAKEFHDAAIRVCTAEPAQHDKPPRLDVVIRVIPRASDEKDLQKRMTADFRTLLKHPSVPAYVTTLTGSAAYARAKSGAVSRTSAYLLYNKKAEQATSQHDRLSAYAFFSA